MPRHIHQTVSDDGAKPRPGSRHIRHEFHGRFLRIAVRPRDCHAIAAEVGRPTSCRQSIKGEPWRSESPAGTVCTGERREPAVAEIIAVGASQGGVQALKTLVAGLPRNFETPILVVLHIGAERSILPAILSAP